jgi:hypothetical protein
MAAELLPTNIDYENLADVALKAQRAARARHARPTDCFLVTPVNDTSQEQSLWSPAEVIPFDDFVAQESQSQDSEQVPVEGLMLNSIVSEANGHNAGLSSPYCADTLPGRAPLLDHLLVRVNASPDWQTLAPAIELLREQRLQLSPPEDSLEVTLGQSSEADILAAVEFLKTHIEKTKEQFFISPLAVEVRGVRVAAGSEFNVKDSSEAQQFAFHLVGKGKENECSDREESRGAEMMPVRLSVGHIGWQLHIRLPWQIEEHEGIRQISISRGQLQPQAVTLFQTMDGLVGGASENLRTDLRKFLTVVETLYGEQLCNDLLDCPVELSVLARFAGYNAPNASLAALSWIALGKRLPSETVLSADGDECVWLESWQDLPQNLKASNGGKSV